MDETSRSLAITERLLADILHLVFMAFTLEVFRFRAALS